MQPCQEFVYCRCGNGGIDADDCRSIHPNTANVSTSHLVFIESGFGATKVFGIEVFVGVDSPRLEARAARLQVVHARRNAGDAAHSIGIQAYAQIKVWQRVERSEPV